AAAAEAARRGAGVAIEGLTRGRIVGRGAELEQLQELWRQASAGRAHLALVSGEPGIGKTRLAFELMASAQLDGAIAVTGGCYENEATTPYLPFVEAFRRLVRERNDADLRELLGDTAVDIARLAPEIEERLGPFPERAALGPQEERLRLFDSVARFLRRLAARRGLFFFLDDLQWADHGSLALLHYLLRDLTADRILFLGTYREVELDRAHALSKALVDWNRERLATRVRLDRLDHAATSRMVATLLGQDEVSGSFVASLHGETEGNPFFVEEIVKAMIADGVLVHRDGGWTRDNSGELMLPQSVKAAIGSRLEQVSDVCTEVLRTAAVLGKVFAFNELLSTAHKTEDEVLDALDEASAAQLIQVRAGETFAFTHDKIREVLYEEINPIRRRRVHKCIAEGLEEMVERGEDVPVQELAHHCIESGDLEKGLRYAERAADSAAKVFAWNEAVDMLQRARDCAEALERPADAIALEERIGDMAFTQGEHAAAIASFERAFRAEADPDRKNALRAKCAEACVAASNPRGRAFARTVMEELDPERHPHAVARAMTAEARYRHVEGDLEDALALYREAVPLAEAGTDATMRVRLYSYISGTLSHLGRIDEAEEFAERCVAFGEENDVPEGVLLGLEFLAEFSFIRGRWDAGLAYQERERDYAREVHAADRLAWA
ncbi:MAG: AAA family ATPase, partial [Gemmatimonadetes bacterium]|nr:AAA family ATPase [Gemmatimonadota bacterium]